MIHATAFVLVVVALAFVAAVAVRDIWNFTHDLPCSDMDTRWSLVKAFAFLLLLLTILGATA